MALLGRGLLGVWHDVEFSKDEDLTDFHDWYTREHFPERLRVPGFMRGRRYEAVSGEPYYAALYETESIKTLASATYHKRLDNPTPWSSRNLARFKNTNRTAFEVKYSAGFGLGSGLVVIWLSPKYEMKESLKDWLIYTTLPDVLVQPGIVGAHFCIADPLVTRVDSTEAHIRAMPDQMADWIVMIEGHNQQVLEQALSHRLSSEEFGDQGISFSSTTFHRLIHSATSDDHSNFTI